MVINYVDQIEDIAWKNSSAKNYIQNTSIRYKENDEQYGKVVRILGNCRFNVLCSDGLERLSIMRGKFKKRKYINLHDIVLLEVWDFQDSKASIVDVYTDDNVKKLMKTPDFPKIFIDSLFGIFRSFLNSKIQFKKLSKFFSKFKCSQIETILFDISFLL